MVEHEKYCCRYRISEVIRHLGISTVTAEILMKEVNQI